MYDPAQILLIIIVIVLTILLIILGIQVFLILRDLRVTIQKTNKVLDETSEILDDTAEITEAVKGPVVGFSSAIMGLKTGSALLGLINKVSSNKEKKDGK